MTVNQALRKSEYGDEIRINAKEGFELLRLVKTHRGYRTYADVRWTMALIKLYCEGFDGVTAEIY